MKVSFIGAGKVSTAFGKYIKNSGIEVLYYYSRNIDSSKKSAEYVGCSYTSDLEKLISNSEYIFITTFDDEIVNVAKNIIELKLDIKDKIFVHMSGALTSSILSELSQNVFSLHPLQSFSDIDKAVLDLDKTYFSLEGKNNLNYIEKLLNKISNKYFILNEDQKIKYHLSACVFSNYLVTLMDFGMKLLEDIGINKDEGLLAMDPLIMATYSNIKKNSTKLALTGPIQRGDLNTLKKHLNQLDGIDLEVYKSLGKMTTERLVDTNVEIDKLWRS